MQTLEILLKYLRNDIWPGAHSLVTKDANKMWSRLGAVGDRSLLRGIPRINWRPIVRGDATAIKLKALSGV
jgi:hypothetical protein